MTKEIAEENGERFTISQVGGGYGFVVWMWRVDRWIFQRGGFDSFASAEKFCRRESFPFVLA